MVRKNKNDNNRKKPGGLPRPSVWWIYGLVGAFICGWYLFGESSEAPLESD